MKKRLSHKAKGFVKDIVKGETGVQAALNNYDTTDYNTANVIAVENLQKPTIIAAIKSLADSIPDELVTEKHIALLTKTDLLGGIDVQAVKAGVEMSYKLKGSFAPEKTESKITLEKLSEEDKEELRKLLKK